MNSAPSTAGVPGPGRKSKLVTIVLILFFVLAGFFIANAVSPIGTQRLCLRVADWWYNHSLVSKTAVT